MNKNTLTEKVLLGLIQSGGCLNCKHYNTVYHNCDAFPNGIPFEILNGTRTHDTPYPGDHGIHFEVRDFNDIELALINELFDS